MPNCKKHIETGALTGAVAGALVNLIKQVNNKNDDPLYQFNWLEFATYVLAGAGIGSVCGIMPDLLEPASNGPCHRKFFHSLAAGSAVAFGVYKVNNSGVSHEAKQMLTAGGCAYLSHLLMDSETPKGLPLVV
jgi:membrane-bound metal-dependent hydrolase YbcI (DUF457 family)